MGQITGYTATRMKAIEDRAVVGGVITAGRLILTRNDATTIDAGSVIGPQGVAGPAGPTSITVCTSGTRPTGGARFTGLGIYETDTKRFYIFDGTIWIYRGGTFICTSTTRPTTPFTGLEIYETDTAKKLIYNGVRFDPPWNRPWGQIAETLTNVDQVFANGADNYITNLTTPFVAVVNRKYRMTFHGLVKNLSATLPEVITVRFRRPGIIIETTIIQIIAALNLSVNMFTEFTVPTAVSTAMDISLTSDQAAGFTIRGSLGTCRLKIEDLGPNGALLPV